MGFTWHQQMLQQNKYFGMAHQASGSKQQNRLRLQKLKQIQQDNHNHEAQILGMLASSVTQVPQRTVADVNIHSPAQLQMLKLIKSMKQQHARARRVTGQRYRLVKQSLSYLRNQQQSKAEDGVQVDFKQISTDRENEVKGSALDEIGLISQQLQQKDRQIEKLTSECLRLVERLKQAQQAIFAAHANIKAQDQRIQQLNLQISHNEQHISQKIKELKHKNDEIGEMAEQIGYFKRQNVQLTEFESGLRLRLACIESALIEEKQKYERHLDSQHMRVSKLQKDLQAKDQLIQNLNKQVLNLNPQKLLPSLIKKHHQASNQPDHTGSQHRIQANQGPRSDTELSSLSSENEYDLQPRICLSIATQTEITHNFAETQTEMPGPNIFEADCLEQIRVRNNSANFSQLSLKHTLSEQNFFKITVPYNLAITVPQTEPSKELNKLSPMYSPASLETLPSYSQLHSRVRALHEHTSLLSKFAPGKYVTNIEQKITFMADYASRLEIYFSKEFLSLIKSDILMGEELGTRTLARGDWNSCMVDLGEPTSRLLEASFRRDSGRLGIMGQFSIHTYSNLKLDDGSGRKQGTKLRHERVLEQKISAKTDQKTRKQQIKKQLNQIKQFVVRQGAESEIFRDRNFALFLQQLQGNKVSQMLISLIQQNQVLTKCVNQMLQHEQSLAHDNNQSYFAEAQVQQKQVLQEQPQRKSMILSMLGIERQGDSGKALVDGIKMAQDKDGCSIM